MILPDCTIVMPVRNRAELVKRTLNSISSQLYKQMFVVLVDNGSTDGTMQVLQEWKEFNEKTNFRVQILQEPRPGATIARNTGLDAVETEYVMFFDSDDTMSPWHLSGAMGYIFRHPSIDILGWDVNMHYGDNVVKRKFYTHNMMYHNIMHGGFATQRYLCRTELVRKAGGWNPDLLYWNDIELGARLLSLSSDLVIHKLKQKPTVDVYHTDNSITGQRYSDNADRALFALDQIEQAIAPDQKRIVDLKRAVLAGDIYHEGEHEKAQQIIDSTLQRVKSAKQRILLKGVFDYARHGGRGAARIVQHII